MTDHLPVLLIGASGMIGSAIASLLPEHGYKVRVFAREGGSSVPLAQPADEVVRGSIVTGEGLVDAVKGVQAVLYFASTSVPATSGDNPAIEFQASLPPLTNVLNALVRYNPQARFFFPSTGGAIYGSCDNAPSESSPTHPLSAYALGKALAEQTIRFYNDVFNIRSDILRISNAYGNARPRSVPQGVIDHFLDDAIRGVTSQVWGSLEVQRDYIFVDDVAHAVLALLEATRRPSSVFNVGQSESHSLRQVLNLIEQVTEGRHCYELVKDQYAGVARSSIDCSLLTHAVGWRPSVSLQDGVALAWRRKNEFRNR
ncbi:NAD-dependent epimerase/dehydratase family protein [Paraburkholderia xenovorans]|uniref:NAD-dependent epimerase/dehydratase family protein n=1 Tax=Paraburkholderia xenovorans TaxID=36873 RepID=UPI0038B759F0